LGDGPRINLLDQWIEAQMVLLDPARHQLMEHDQKATKTDADSLFLHLLGVQAGPRPTTPS
jgi:hypothetical protein